MNEQRDVGVEASFGVRLKRVLFRLVFGNEIEWGDSFFYSILSLVLIGLLWLMTVEKWFNLSIWFCLIPWAALVVLIWRAYYRQRKG